MIRVWLNIPSPALRAGVMALLAEDPEIDVSQDREGLGADVEIVASPGSGEAPRSQRGAILATSVLMLQDEPIDVRQLLQSGSAMGVLPLDASAQELTNAVRALASGLVVAAGPLISLAGETRRTDGPLTDREIEVLGLLSRGLANKQIALELGISEHTVKFHVSSIYAKLNASNRTQAVREGLQNGWIAL